MQDCLPVSKGLHGPYSADVITMKVLKSSDYRFVFLSTAAFAVCFRLPETAEEEVSCMQGIATTRADSVTTSDSKVGRDMFYTGNPKPDTFAVCVTLNHTATDSAYMLSVSGCNRQQQENKTCCMQGVLITRGGSVSISDNSFLCAKFTLVT